MLRNRKPPKAAKAAIQKRHLDLLKERYDLGDHPASGVTMARKKPIAKAVQERVRVRLAEGQTWEVALVPARNVPFEIRATRTTDLQNPSPICLAALPEASTQEATVVIRSGRFSPRQSWRSWTEPIGSSMTLVTTPPNV